jgi:hypothetical protein
MSWSIDLFVDAHTSLPQFVRDIEAVCDIKFTKFCADAGERYEYRAPHGVVCLWENHALENDQDCNFADYRYELNVRPYRTAEWEHDRQAGYELAMGLFQSLQVTGRYRLMLVEELQKKLQVFDPAAA